MPPRFQVFVVNPGSTSTKLALFTESEMLAEESAPADKAPGGVLDQLPGRLAASEAFLARHHVSRLDAAVGRGGLIRPVPSGTLKVNEAMMDDARRGFQGEHVSNLGCLIAHAVGTKYGAPAFVVDPVAVDEMSPLARYSGLPHLPRQTLSHALNLHAAARKACERVGKSLRESRWVVAHLGGEEAASALLVRLGYRRLNGHGWTRPPISASRGRGGRDGAPRGQRPRPRRWGGSVRQRPPRSRRSRR